ncbi:hypothetical protein [Fulvivirga sp.]|uniref:hypothetical protein n=1 Tax=Fulvivirga sp. TaxID=1931237 RepID=UPI0032EF0C32
MKKITTMLLVLLGFSGFAQHYKYAPSSENPFGLPNPNAPKEITDYKEMIGKCNCKSLARIDQNTWADTVAMTWEFRYIMDGMAVQDITNKEDGAHSGSIRQYNADSAKWYVHYYATSGAPSKLPVWEGNRTDDKIILYKDQNAPNGTPGYYRITFFNISNKGFDWLGEWVDKKETFSHPIWKIFCKRGK